MRKLLSSPLSQLVRAANPLALLAGILFFALGAGIVDFRNQPFSWVDYWLGQACITLLQMSSAFLKAFYDRIDEDRTPPSQRSPEAKNIEDEENAPKEVLLPRLVFLQAGMTTLSVGAIVAVLLLTRGAMNASALLLLGIAFGVAFFYSVPPLRLAYTGYGELCVAFFLANLTPAFAFVLLSHDLDAHLLGLLTFPLTLLCLAMLLAISLEHYYRDLKQGRTTMMVRLGWQRGMLLHNLLVPLAYFCLGVTALMGLSWSLLWPAMLTLPIGAFQVWQMWQIGNGAPTRWPLLRLTAYATVGLTAYFLTFSLWVG
ncbi:prenyltransferase [uncultured Thermanaerothrix sp.]|uniref:prenyltransferase n=1 Tax=uncultured Thermanaerothrix sp. TaxID=1195149 RepID=UPI002605007F|nr:prenyltransferase [uncultured Thermanaerothrix sp.]